MKIPATLINFKAYDENGSMFKSNVDCELPNLEYIKATVEGAGVAGPVDLPVLGTFDNMTTTISLRTPTQDLARFAVPKGQMITLRGALQDYDTRSGTMSVAPVAVTMRVLPSTLTPGSFQVAGETDTSAELNVDYFKMYVDGKLLFEIDRHNFIAIIDGKDYLEEVRAALGM